jgi:hypothetical protein
VEFCGPFHANGKEEPLRYVKGDLCVPLDFSSARALVTDLMAERRGLLNVESKAPKVNLE